MIKPQILLLLSGLLFINCSQVDLPTPRIIADTDLPIEKINLPENFKIEVYAEGLENARSMALSPSGTLFVGTRSKGSVYALVDRDKDYRPDEVYTIAEGLSLPNGVAFRDGDLYVAEVNRVIRYKDIEANLETPPSPEVIYDEYPSERHHGWKYIAFGPDGKLYIPVGAPCNICESEDKIFNSITRINPDGSGFEIVHEGIRNTVGFTWHPKTKDLWFTDNGRDWLGDDSPACELNYAPQDGMHFGYPYCHQGNMLEKDIAHQRTCDEFTAPVQNLGPHVAPLGMEFYTQKQFPNKYKDYAFIAEHGSWNRSQKIGYRITMVRLEGNEAKSYEVFADGWLDEAQDDVWGRPVDIEMLPDGSMLVSDDFADAIYRIFYEE